MNIVIIVEFGDMYVCIRMGHKAGPWTATFNDLLCLIRWHNSIQFLFKFYGHTVQTPPQMNLRIRFIYLWRLSEENRERPRIWRVLTMVYNTRNYWTWTQSKNAVLSGKRDAITQYNFFLGNRTYFLVCQILNLYDITVRTWLLSWN
jgi:hypothetical protein